MGRTCGWLGAAWSASTQSASASGKDSSSSSCGADNDVPAQFQEDGADGVRVFFQGHDGVFRLQSDQPEFGRIRDLLDEAIRRKGRVWFVALKPDLTLLAVLPAGWAAEANNSFKEPRAWPKPI